MTRVELLLRHPQEKVVPGDPGVVHKDVDPAVRGQGCSSLPASTCAASETPNISTFPCRRPPREPTAFARAGVAPTSFTTTVAPSAQNSSAIDRPIPRAEPVTSPSLSFSFSNNCFFDVGVENFDQYQEKPHITNLALHHGAVPTRMIIPSRTRDLFPHPSSLCSPTATNHRAIHFPSHARWWPPDLCHKIRNGQLVASG